MIENLIKLKVGLVLIILMVLSPLVVNAQSYHDQIELGAKIPDLYVTKKHDGRTWVDYVYFLIRKSDYHWVYCIQPGVKIDASATYYGMESDWQAATSLSEAQLTRIKLLAYYGYGYQEKGYNHTDDNWYAITQMLIWRTAGVDWDIYFTDRLDGNQLPFKFDLEIQELEFLVSQHFLAPNFGDTAYILNIMEELVLSDYNHILTEYTVVGNNDDIPFQVSGNNLIIKASNPGLLELTISKTSSRLNSNPVVYVNPESQNVYMVGDLAPITMHLKIEVYQGEVIIEKTGEEVIIADDSFTYQEVPLAGCVFGLYDENDKLLASGLTNDKGILSFPDLKLDKAYYLQELATNSDHLLDQNKYYFMLKKNDSYITTYFFSLKNHLIKGDLEFLKTDLATGEELSGVVIEIFTDNHQKIYEGTTDNSGQIIINNLFKGKFYLKEKYALSGYYLDEALLNFAIKENDSIVKLRMTNEKIPELTVKLEPEPEPMVIVPVPNTGADITNPVYILPRNQIYDKLRYGKK